MMLVTGPACNSGAGSQECPVGPPAVGFTLLLCVWPVSEGPPLLEEKRVTSPTPPSMQDAQRCKDACSCACAILRARSQAASCASVGVPAYHSSLCWTCLVNEADVRRAGGLSCSTHNQQQKHISCNAQYPFVQLDSIQKGRGLPRSKANRDRAEHHARGFLADAWQWLG